MVNENCVARIIAALMQTDSDAWCKPALNMCACARVRACVCVCVLVSEHVTWSFLERSILHQKGQIFTYKCLEQND